MTTPSRKLRGVYLRGKTYWLAHQHHGRRVWTSLKTADYVEAVNRASAFVRSPADNPTLGLRADAATFIAERLADRSYTRATARTHRISLNRFALDLGYPDTDSVTTEQIQAWFDQLKSRVSLITAQRYVFDVRAFFRWCVATRRLAHSPAAAVAIGRPATCPPVRFCSAAERDLLISQAPNDSLRYILFAGFHAGLRKTEIVQSRPSWFNLGNGTLTLQEADGFVPKNRKARTVPLTKAFRDFLTTYGLRTPYMLHPEDARPQQKYRADYERPFRAHVTACGLPWVTSHTMRHTFASLLASRGCSIYKIAVWLGDTLSVTQDHYAKLLPSDVDIELLA